jgi:hypothetical protein
MSRSLTLPVPSLRTVVLAVVGIAVAIAVIFGVARLTASILSPSPVMDLAAEGGLHEVQVLGGSVYLGTIVTDDGSMLRLARPAIVRQEQVPEASPGTQGSRVIVQSLTTDPFGIAADIVIPLEVVTFIGVLEPSSSLAVAYGEAMGPTQPPAATPSPSP